MEQLTAAPSEKQDNGGSGRREAAPLFTPHISTNMKYAAPAEYSVHLCGYVRVRVTHSRHAWEMCGGTVYLQSMIIVSVSLSLASWKGGWPQTSMKRITPRLQISAETQRECRLFIPIHPCVHIYRSMVRGMKGWRTNRVKHKCPFCLVTSI